MQEFKACLKKDYLDQKRNKKFLVYCLITVGLALFTFIIAVVANKVMQGEDMPEMAKKMFELTYENSIMYFSSFMAVYFTLVVILMLKGTISKERKDHKWVLPVASGIEENKMIASKLITQMCSILIAMVIGCLVHFIGTVIIFDKAGSTIGTLFANYGALIIFCFFVFVSTICLDAIFNKPLVSALVPILFIMFGSSVLDMVTIKGVSLLNYSPWLLSDANIFLKPSSFGAWEWIFGLGTYVGILVLLVCLSLKVGQHKKEN